VESASVPLRRDPGILSQTISLRSQDNVLHIPKEEWAMAEQKPQAEQPPTRAIQETKPGKLVEWVKRLLDWNPHRYGVKKSF
jgi:hypothetical protein